jgi:hypothetical protein
MYLRTCGSFKFQVRKPQKDWVRKSQIRKVSNLPKVHKSHKGPHIYGFAISGTYLLTAHLCQLVVINQVIKFATCNPRLTRLDPPPHTG